MNLADVIEEIKKYDIYEEIEGAIFIYTTTSEGLKLFRTCTKLQANHIFSELLKDQVQ